MELAAAAADRRWTGIACRRGEAGRIERIKALLEHGTLHLCYACDFTAD